MPTFPAVTVFGTTSITPPTRRMGGRAVAALLSRLLAAEADEAELLDDDRELARHLDRLALRARRIAEGRR